MKFDMDLILLIPEPEWTADQLLFVKRRTFETVVTAKFLEKSITNVTVGILITNI